MSLENGSCISDHCELCRYVKLRETCPDTRNRNSAPLESESSARETEHILNTSGSYEQRSRRKRKGRHRISLENASQHLPVHAHLVIEPQVSHTAEQQTFYSCLIVDEGFDETMAALKVHSLTANLGSFI